MNYLEMIQAPKGTRPSAYMEQVVREAYDLLTSVLALDDLETLRKRNEALTAYLSKMVLFTAVYQERVDELNREFESKNARPTEKGISYWKEARDAFTRVDRRILAFMMQTHSTIEKKLNVSQTNIKTKSQEYQNATRQS